MEASFIAKGRLKTSDVYFEVRRLDRQDLREMLDLQETVRQTLQDATALQPLSKEEFEYIFSRNGFIIGVYVYGQIIAFRAMLVPPLDDPAHLGTDAGISAQTLHQVIYSEITVVHPGYRGNGLQTYMGKMMMDEVDKARYPYVVATVAPFNIPSLKDKLALGMVITALKEKYNGKLRYVFFKDLKQEDEQAFSDTKQVAMGATGAQQQFMQEGYRGVAIEQVCGTWYVMYQR